MNPTHSIHKGERNKLRGMTLAAVRKARRIAEGQRDFLDVLLRSTDACATLDDCTPDLLAEFDDGGKWRGTVTSGLALAGIIRTDGVVRSKRATRHRGLMHRWRVADRDAAEAKRAELDRWLADHPEPVDPDLFSQMQTASAVTPAACQS